MTYEERTNLESYLRNINNLIALKMALEESLDYTKMSYMSQCLNLMIMGSKM